MPPSTRLLISPAPRFEVMMMMHCERSTRRLSPRVKRRFVQDAEQQLPERVGGLLDFVEQQDRELQLLGVPLVQRFLRQQRMGLAMAQVSRRRADQLGDFVRVLEFGAVDLDAGAGVAEERFGHGFDDPGFARAGGPEEQQIANRTSRRIQSRQKHLVDFDHFLDGLVLADDLAAQGAFEFPGIVAAASWDRARCARFVLIGSEALSCLSWARSYFLGERSVVLQCQERQILSLSLPAPAITANDSPSPA